MFIISSLYQLCWCTKLLNFSSECYYKEEIKENNAWFIYAIGVNFAEGVFMHVKSCHDTF